MQPRKQITPKSVAANGLQNPFTGMKRWTIRCGECSHSYRDRIPVAEPCSSLCPGCGAQNIWSGIAFGRLYDQHLEEPRG